MPTDRKTAARLVAIVCAAQVFVQLGAGYWPVLLPERMAGWSLTNGEAGWITSAFYAEGAMDVGLPFEENVLRRAQDRSELELGLLFR
jgi:hypothetical protein